MSNSRRLTKGNSTRLDARLTKGFPASDREIVQNSYANSKFLREHLIKVLTREIESVTITMEGEAFYEKPNLEARIFRGDGRKSAYRDVIKLLSGQVAENEE